MAVIKREARQERNERKDVARLLSPAFVHSIQRLDLRARVLVDGLLAGRHRSTRMGFSVEFSDYREYVPGDRPEDIDWKVFMRTDLYYVKQYRAETNLRCTIILDASASMDYRSRLAEISKFEYAQSVAAALALLLFRRRDRIGLMTVTDRLTSHVPPRCRRSHLYRIFQQLARTQPASPGRLGRALAAAAAQLKRRGLVLIISDFLPAYHSDDPSDGTGPAADLAEILRQVGHLRFRGHDVILLHVIDPAEREFPFTQPAYFVDPESGRDVEIDPRQAAYRAAAERWINALVQGAARHRAEYVLITTDQPFDQALGAFLAARRIK